MMPTRDHGCRTWKREARLAVVRAGREGESAESEGSAAALNGDDTPGPDAGTYRLRMPTGS